MKLKAANRASKYLTDTQEKIYSSRIYVFHQWKEEKLPWRFKKDFRVVPVQECERKQAS